MGSGFHPLYYSCSNFNWLEVAYPKISFLHTVRYVLSSTFQKPGAASLPQCCPRLACGRTQVHCWCIRVNQGLSGLGDGVSIFLFLYLYSVYGLSDLKGTKEIKTPMLNFLLICFKHTLIRHLLCVLITNINSLKPQNNPVK